jgi:general secretion pathway protein D
MSTLSRHVRNGVMLIAGLLLSSLGQCFAQNGSDKKPPAEEKAFVFEMRAKPWNTVFEWLSDKTGRPFISQTLTIPGTFNFIGPKDKKYTVPQIIDVINDALLVHKWVMLNRGTSFTIVAADEKIDPALVPRIAMTELPEHGNTEIVSTVYQCKSLVAEDSAPEVKKQMGPFGEVIILHKANQLILQDTVGNLNRIKRDLDDQETKEASGGQAETYAHRCTYIRARDAEATLRSFLGQQTVIETTVRPGPGGPMGTGGPPMGSGSTGGAPNGREDRARPATTQKIRSYTVTSDERTNTVFVNGPPDKIAQAKAVMAKLDVGTVPITIGAPVLQTYPVKEGNADALSKTLLEIHKGSAGIKIAPIGNNQIMVLASPEDQLIIAAQINGTRPPASRTELINLTLLDAARTVETLKGLFPDSKNGAPYLEADPSRNVIIVKGTVDQVGEVRLAIGAIGENPSAQGGNMRIITLDKGSAATLAEALQRMLTKMRDNPVTVVAPSLEPKLEAPKKEDPKKEAEPKKEAAPKPKSQNDDSCGEQSQLVDPQEQKAPAKGKGAPVTITAFGSKLIVTSEDPAALALVSELVRLLTRTQGPADFEVIRLKYANAVDTAKVLDEVFNGPKPTVGGGRGNRGGGGFPLGFAIPGIMGQPGGGAGNTPREDRIRVVADPATNALLVQASPLDMLTIRNLLDKQLDAGVTDSEQVIKTFVIGPLKYAYAIDVASVIRDVYRESMNNNFRGLGQISSPFTGSTRAPASNLDANGNPKGVTLSLGIDDKTNSLIVACPTSMYNDIKKLVEQMEIAASDTKQTVKIVQVKGVDPALIQQALDVLQGRSAGSRSSSRSDSFSPFGGGSFGGSPFGGSPFGGGSGSRTPTFGGTGLVPGPVPGGLGFPGGGIQGFTPGGGGFRGTGGGGGPRGGGGGVMTRPPGSQSRGPDFFEYRVKDDPQPILFDPQLETATALSKDVEPFVVPAQAAQYANTYQPIMLVAAGEKPMPAAKGPDLLAPRLPVNAEALEQLGIIVIRSNNPADMEAALKIIEYVQKLGAEAEIQISLVPLKHADATSVTNTLNQLFARVVVGPYSNTQISSPVRPGGQFGQPGGAPVQPGAAPAAQPQTGQTQTAAATSLVFIPVVRQNAILLAAPKSRVDNIMKEIARLDIPLADDGRAVAFPLKRASAARVALLVTNFYSDRFPNEAHAQHQIRVTYDDGTNTVFVQAAPADLVEIRSLIEHIDTTFSNAVNDLRVVPLRNALAEDLAAIITRAVTENYTETSGTAAGTAGGAAPTAPGGPLGGAGPGATGLLGGVGGNQPAMPRQTKVKALRLLSNLKGGKTTESGIFDDVRITADARTNSLIVDAPPQTMQLIYALIKEMDIPPAARAEITVFHLKRADAIQTATTLQQLFLGQGGLGSTGTRTGGTGLGGPTGLPTTGAALGGASLGSPRPLQFTISGTTPEGAPLIDLRLTVDERTNSLVVAGSRNDLDVIEAIIAKLETADPRARRSEAYKLRNALAADIAAALNDFLPKSLKVITNSGQLSGFQELQKDVVITPEPISNTLLINAAPEYFDEVMKLVIQLDVLPPQVVIQVLVAEVDLMDSNEFGVEIGLQSPIIFSRGLTAVTGSTGTTTATLNQTLTGGTNPGFAFNNVNIPAGNNSVVNPSLVGYQGLNNLGVGRVSPVNGVGGFVFSAASNSFNLLIRALKVQDRIDILSRPQIMTLDNQTALINVGKEIPIITSSSVTATGVVSNNIDRRQVGVILQVTPKIYPDGRVLMRIIPEVSAVDPTPVVIGTNANGTPQVGTALQIQHLETTVTAEDGETVALGGLISKSDTKTENKIPWLGDLPGVGALFRYRTQNRVKKELLIIMTPHIVRCREDAERILAEESRKIDWMVSDVAKIHGNPFRDPLFLECTRPDGSGPLGPTMSTPRINELPVPQQLPPPAQKTPAGPTSQNQAPPHTAQPLPVQAQPLGVVSASAPPPGPALLPQSLTAAPTMNPGQTTAPQPSPTSFYQTPPLVVNNARE